MKKSESIKEIGIALAKFNGEVSKIAKDAKNSQFRSDYVTLDALIEATRPILQANGLSIMQFPLTRDNGEIGVKTVLLHDSGEFIESEPLYMMPTRMIKGGGYEIARDPQAAGSVISYLRRYSYQAILNLNTGEDDDASKSTPTQEELGKTEIKQMTVEEAGAIVVDFGTKHKGETLKTIYKSDKSYFDWLREKTTDPIMKIACEAINEAVNKANNEHLKVAKVTS